MKTCKPVLEAYVSCEKSFFFVNCNFGDFKQILLSNEICLITYQLNCLTFEIGYIFPKYAFSRSSKRYQA